jgi:hypothetical protein
MPGLGPAMPHAWPLQLAGCQGHSARPDRASREGHVPRRRLGLLGLMGQQHADREVVSRRLDSSLANVAVHGGAGVYHRIWCGDGALPLR